MRILLAEDDPHLLTSIARGLKEATHEVDPAMTGPEALALAEARVHDVIVLDVLLPGLSGLAVCEAIRQRGDRVPILMLTALDAVEHRIAGLDAGADDYLVKPFDFGELLARLRALLRRPEAVQPMRVQVADLVIDLQSHSVTRGDTNITLTGKEFALLELLARNVRRVVSRADIVAHVWDDNHDPFTNAVEVYMNRLRGKIDRDSDTPVLHTRRGVGYILTDDPPG
jgi:two-component system copper resistance phosphate regulon response regulator CusR